MTIWKGRTPSYEHWKAEVQHERRAMGDFKPPFADEHDAKKRYNFLVRIGFFQTTKETEHDSPIVAMMKKLFKG